MRSLRGITFDLDDTLLDRRATFALFVREQLSRFGPFFSRTDLDGLSKRIIELDADGATPRDELFSIIAREFSIGEIAAEVLTEDFGARFPVDVVASPRLTDVLREFKDAGARLAIITNGSIAIQRRKIEAMGIEHLFDYIGISEAEGHRKPEPEIFRSVVSRLGLSPAETVHVGDNPVADISGAKAAGMAAIWIDGRGRPTPAEADAIIEDIGALPAALKKLGRVGG